MWLSHACMTPNPHMHAVCPVPDPRMHWPSYKALSRSPCTPSLCSPCQVYLSSSSKVVWGQSKVCMQAAVSDFLGELWRKGGAAIAAAAGSK